MSDPVVVPPVTVTPPAPPPVVAPPPEPQTFSVEYVKELRAESKGYRLKLAETEAQKKAADEAVAKATADADAKIKDANTAAERRIIRAELKAFAVKAGMVDLDGLQLMDLSKLKLNDAGEVEGAEALLAAFKLAKPYLFGTESTSSTAPVPPANVNTPKSAKDMTPEEFAAAKRALGRRSRA